LGTIGNVKEFLIWETKNTIIYRTDKNEVIGRDLVYPTSTNYGHMGGSLLRIMDPNERRVLDRQNRVYDTVHGESSAIDASCAYSQPIDWRGDSIYSATTSYDTRKRIFTFSKYDLQSKQSSTICSLSTREEDNYQLASGHKVPQVVLYSTQNLALGTFVSLAKVDLNQCKITSVYSYAQNPMKGRIRKVTYSQEADTAQIEFEGPNGNQILLDQGGLCSVIDSENQNIVSVNQNPYFPAWLTWNHAANPTLIMSVQQQIYSLKILEGFPIESLLESDIWMTQSIDSLFLSPKLVGRNRKWVYQIPISNFLKQTPRYGN